MSQIPLVRRSLQHFDDEQAAALAYCLSAIVEDANGIFIGEIELSFALRSIVAEKAGLDGADSKTDAIAVSALFSNTPLYGQPAAIFQIRN